MHGAPTLRRALGAALGMAAFAIALRRLLQTESDDPERLFCAALALALAFFLAVATRRAGFGFLCAGALVGCVWLAGALKLAYLHEPLMAPDLGYFLTGTTVDVVMHYPAIWHKLALALIGGLLLACTVWRLESPGFGSRCKRRARVAWSALALLPLLLFAWPQGPFRSVYVVSTWGFIGGARSNPTTGFVRSFTRMGVSVPAYTLADARREDWGSTSAAMPTRAPNIVAVLEESTLDPRQWAVCTVPRCTFPLFQPDRDTNAYGMLKVHTYGGGTWTSEFAFLAGLPHTLFGPAGIYAPYNLAPRTRETLPRQLKALGYRTIAIYPMPRDFVRAGAAYADYGFDTFLDSNDLDLAWGSSDGEVMQRFEDVLRRERAKGDRPLFFMVLTMRQHGPHDEPLDSLPPPWNQAPLPALDAQANREIGTYLYRLHQSSEAIAALRQFLFADGRPTVLVHFGDHHPSFGGREGKLASALPSGLRAEANHLTYFRIDSNLDPAPVTAYPVLDLAFLGGLVLDVAGLPKNAYFEANTRLRERCDGRFLDCPQRAVLDSWLARTFGELRAFAK